MSDFVKGDKVVLKATVVHVRDDGGVDVKTSSGDILFNQDPDKVRLIIHEGKEKE